MNIENFKNKKILVTGANGFVGSNLIIELNKQGFTNLLTPSSTELNLLTGATGIVTASNAVTMTNKTINGSNNTLTNINASSIGSGNVSNTEFEYLDGLSSNVQNQLYVLSVALGS
jgi:UDP-glucose 4-epimerase